MLVARVTLEDFIRTFEKFRPDNFSRAGLYELFDIYEELSETDEDEMMLVDYVAIAVEWAEESLTEFAENYFSEDEYEDLDEKELLEKVTDYISERTTYSIFKDEKGTVKVLYQEF